MFDGIFDLQLLEGALLICFADDTLLTQRDSAENAVRRLNQALVTVVHWVSSVGLKIYASKTNVACL